MRYIDIPWSDKAFRYWCELNNMSDYTWIYTIEWVDWLKSQGAHRIMRTTHTIRFKKQSDATMFLLKWA
jgi:hypothetical protein